MAVQLSPATMARIQKARQLGISEQVIAQMVNTELMARQAQAQVSKPPVREGGFVQKAADYLPVAGGLVGGIGGTVLGGPVGGIAGATLLAGAGEAARQRIQGEEANAGKIAQEAVLSGGGELIGLGAGRLIGKVAPKVISKLPGIGRSLEEAGEAVTTSVRKIRVKPSIYGAGTEKAINKTLTELGFSGSPEKQYEMLEPTLEMIEKKITEYIAKNPRVGTTKEQLKQSFFNSLKSRLRSKDLTSKQALSEINGYLTDLLRASGELEGGLRLGKTKITLERLRAMKKLINEDYGPIHDILERGGALTPRQKVIAAAWDSLDNSIKDLAPEVKGLLTKESHLYKAAPSLSAARFNPPTQRLFGTSIPGQVTQTATDLAGKAIKGAGKAVGKAEALASKSAAKEALEGLWKQMGANTLKSTLGQGATRALFSGAGVPEDIETPEEFDQYVEENPEALETLGLGTAKPKFTAEMAALLMLQNPKQASVIEKAYKLMNSGEKLTLSDTAIKNVSDLKGAITDVQSLSKSIGSSQAVGPVRGHVAKLPYATGAKSLQAEIDRVRQVVGKALEGGVLRKEDEEKYKKILPTMTDTKAVALSKLKKLDAKLRQDLKTYTTLQKEYGKGKGLEDIVNSLGAGLE